MVKRSASFRPRITRTKTGAIRARATITITTFEAEFSLEDIPLSRYDRRLWAIDLFRQWHQRVQVGTYLPEDPFTMEHLAQANRHADILLARIDEWNAAADYAEGKKGI